MLVKVSKYLFKSGGCELIDQNIKATKGYTSDAALNLLQSIRSAPDSQSFDIHYRTLGDVAYFMTSLNTGKENVQVLQERIINALNVE